MFQDSTLFLKNAKGIDSLLSQAALLLRLQAAFRQAVPLLAESARVVNLDAGAIIVHAENGAVATKLRQMAGRLLQELSRCHRGCANIEILVKPQNEKAATLSPTKPPPEPLSPKAREALEKTIGNLSASPLRETLKKLLAGT